MLRFNQDRIERIMHDFFTLANIRIVLFSDAQEEILAYPENRCLFCASMRTNLDFLKQCVHSDQLAFEKSRRFDKPLVYTCHAGLTEAVIPIRQEDVILGYVMFGQVILNENETAARNHLKAKYASGDEAIAKVIDSIVCKTDKEIKAAATILEALTTYLLSNKLVSLRKAEFIQSLDNYIDGHLHEKILVEDICKYFLVQRSQLYEISIPYLGCGIAEYIRKRKVMKAGEMLVNTDLSITQISSLVGFSEYNYFSRVFHQETGMSARSYRNLHITN